MPCTNCYTEFGIFRKEVGCEKCKFAFCSNCCKKQSVASETGGQVKRILCNKCYDCVVNPANKESEISPPLSHKKRMEAFKTQSYSVDSEAHSRLQSQWVDAKDRALAERLQKLKRDRVKVESPSENEIEERLAKLKGMDPARYNAPPIQVFRPEKRTSIEQICDLMTQVKAEVKLDSRLVKPEDEIAARLARLRDQVPKEEGKNADADEISIVTKHSEEVDVDKFLEESEGRTKKYIKRASDDLNELNKDQEYASMIADIKKAKNEDKENNSEDEDEEEAERLIEKLMATGPDEDMDDLELSEPKSSDSDTKKEEPADEEFPWCILCTEDAKIRCFGCDSDLYCMRCFRECHDSLGIKDHKTCPYLPGKAALL